MPLDVEALLVEIEEIHSEADVDQEVHDAVAKAVSEAVAADVPAEVSKDTAALQTQVDAYGSALKTVVDKLTALPEHTEATSAALAAAQNVLPAATGDASVGAAA